MLKSYEARIHQQQGQEIVLQQVDDQGCCDPEDDVAAEPVHLARDVTAALEAIDLALVDGKFAVAYELVNEAMGRKP